ncbi:MAG TPA: BON domain-containing protein [Pirellulales bacterium]|nr:BON domain-containing protein [Pirellulales bacterium]
MNLRKTGVIMGDSQLVERVSSVLEQSPHVPHRNLRFEASQGQVVLRGVVRSYYQKQMAQEAVGNVEGVEAVENQLEVDWA